MNRRLLRSIVTSVLELAGFCVVIWGISMVSWPASVIFAGIALILAGVLGS